MINKNELLFVVDENNNELESLPRHTVHQKGLWHRTAGIWVINKEKQILCQKRSMKKDLKPGFWEAFFGGHLAPHEEYVDSAAKELGEELGITVQKERLIPYNIVKNDKPAHREFQYCFIYELNENDREFSLEKEEVDEVKWFDLEDVRKLLTIEKDSHWVHKPWDGDVLDFILQQT